MKNQYLEKIVFSVNESLNIKIMVYFQDEMEKIGWKYERLKWVKNTKNDKNTKEKENDKDAKNTMKKENEKHPQHPGS